jgi:hypothetical protein
MGTTEEFTPLYKKKILPEFGKGASILRHKITSRVLSALLKTIQEETSAWVTASALPSNLLFGMQMYIIF